MRNGGRPLERVSKEVRGLCDLAVQLNEALDAAEKAAKPDPHLAETAGVLQKQMAAKKKKEKEAHARQHGDLGGEPHPRP